MKRSLIVVAIGSLLAACGTPSVQIPAGGAAGPSTTPTASAAGVATPSTGGNAAAPSPQLVRAVNFAFQPATLTVPVGTSVRFRNDDGDTHTFTSNAGAFNSGNVGTGQSFSFTFSTPGTFAYHCNIHSSMRGVITVSTSATGANAAPAPNSIAAAPSASPYLETQHQEDRHHHDG
jgi:plastocyanin